MSTIEMPAPAIVPLNASNNSTRQRMLLVFVALACIPFYWSVHSAADRLSQRFPQSPWESEIVTDAWRANHGRPVYTLPAQDHATHFYGPLITYLVAAIFRFSKFNLAVPRWIAIISAVAITIGISFVTSRRRGWMIFFVGIALLFMQFYRCRANFAESRPDAASALFAAIALWMFYLAQTRKFWWMIGGVAAMLIAFFFKQTASAVAIVPVIAVLFTRPNQLRKHLLVAIVPLVTLAAAIGILRIVSPAMYYYLIVVPTLFHIDAREWPLKLIQQISMNLFFFIAIVVWAFDRRSAGIDRRASLWLLAAILATAISGSAGTAKWGGKENNYLPTFLTMATFSLAMLPRIIEQITTICATRKSQLLLAAMLGVLFIADATSVPNYESWSGPIYENNGDANYKKIIQRVRQLHGRVICPDDPTIPLLAKRSLNRCVVCELDAVAYAGRPKYVRDEWRDADYLIRAPSSWPSMVPPSELEKLGYTQVADPVFAKSSYSLWHHKPGKKPHAAATASAAPAKKS